VPGTPDGQLPFLVESQDARALVSVVEELGGNVTYVFDNIDALAVTLPPHAVAKLLADVRVTSAARQRWVRRAIVPFELPQVAGSRARRERGEEIVPVPGGTAGRTVRPIPLEELEAGLA
jgi:hypothetical protein